MPREWWFDGIDFSALPGGLLEDGSEAAEALEELLLHPGTPYDLPIARPVFRPARSTRN